MESIMNFRGKPTKDVINLIPERIHGNHVFPNKDSIKITR